MANDKQNKQRRFYLDGYAQHPEWYTWHYEMLKKLKDIDSNTSGDTNVSFDGTASDAFGRLRVSSPLTLFDSSHRYAENDLFNEDITGTASSTFNADQGLVELNVGTASGDQIIKESNKVFAYQPGKSLLIMNTFVMDTAKTNLRQRVGYFGAENGFYIEQDDTTVNLVK